MSGAERLEDIARSFTTLFREGNIENALDNIEPNEKIIRFALKVYARDINESKKRTVKRLERIRDNNDSAHEHKDFFFDNYCKTENLDKLLENIKELERHDLGRQRRR